MGLALCIGNPVERRLGLLSHGYLLQGILVWNIWNRNNQYNFCTLVVFPKTIPPHCPNCGRDLSGICQLLEPSPADPQHACLLGFPWSTPKAGPSFDHRNRALRYPIFHLSLPARGGSHQTHLPSKTERWPPVSGGPPHQKSSAKILAGCSIGLALAEQLPALAPVDGATPGGREFDPTGCW